MSFEDRLGELFRNEDPHAAGPEPAAVIAGARRRRARRRVGAGAAALAVALVCGATALTAGGARPTGDARAEAGAARTASAGATALVPAAPAAPAASPTAIPAPTTTSLPLSPVRQVAPGEKIEIVDGAQMWVTANEKCDDYRVGGTWGSGSGCRDMRSDNLEHDRPNIAAQTHGDRDRSVVASFYIGPTPARIVAFYDGKPTLATLVTTTGMKGWIGYYVVLPPMPAPDANRHRPPASPALGAYDAGGRLLATLSGFAADGTEVKAPDRL
ncbi:hypothetical protein ACIG5E_07890 [Kitasatospora sp. NPDC053057]|uniref:hypothetical protein n=1 Tax=Kitasatospora sp. NPDC053057 TaxID=3364062 RepID=UPI0037C9D388